MVPQGEGSEQGDPLVPALFSLEQNSALQAIKSELLPTEMFFAFLDDIYVVCRPERVTAAHKIVARQLEAHCGIRCHLGKTKVYHKAGVEPPGLAELQRQATEQGSTEQIWVGDQTLPAELQG